MTNTAIVNFKFWTEDFLLDSEMNYLYYDEIAYIKSYIVATENINTLGKVLDECYEKSGNDPQKFVELAKAAGIELISVPSLEYDFREEELDDAE